MVLHWCLQAISQSLADQLPPEPSADCADEISTIRVRAPANKLIVRRFLAVHTLQTLLDYVASEGFHTQDYKVLTTFPRRDVSSIRVSSIRCRVCGQLATGYRD